MRKILITVMLLLMCSSITVSAAIGFSQADDKVIITVPTEEADGTYGTVAIFRRDNYIDDNGIFSAQDAFDALDSADDKGEVVVYTAQEKVADGKLTFSVRPIRYAGLAAEDTISGVYVSVIRLCEEELIEEFLYVSPNERDIVLSELESYKTLDETTRKASVIKCLEKNINVLGFYTDFIDELNQTSLYDSLFEETELTGYDFSDYETFMNNLSKMTVICGLNEGKVDSVADFASELGLSGEVLAKWYDKSFVDSGFLASVTDFVSSKSIDTRDAFDKKLHEAMVLTYVEMADGVGDIKDIVECFSDESGITENYSDGAYLSVMGEAYSSYSKLEEALSGYVPQGQSGSDNKVNKKDKNKSGINISVPAVSDSNVDISYKTQAFDDVPADFWASDAISTLRTKGIISGKTEKMFAPDDVITREEFVKLISAMFALDDSDSEPGFSDTSSDAWYMPYLRAAYSAGVVTGMGDGCFGIGQSITRQDLAVMLHRTLSSQSVVLESVAAPMSFTDADDVADYAKDAVAYLQTSGIISGYTDATFRPHSFASRAEAAQMLYKVLTLIE